MKWLARKRITQGFLFLGSILLCAIATPLIWASSSYLRGKITARQDLRKGIYKNLTYGLPVPWRSTYGRLLKERYNITLIPVAGCSVTTSLTEYVRGYDEVSEEEMKSKFGHDIFEEISSEAQKEWEIQFNPQPPKPSSLPPMKP